MGGKKKKSTAHSTYSNFECELLHSAVLSETSQRWCLTYKTTSVL